MISNILPHLIELKRRAIFCIVWFFCCFGCAYYFSEKIYNFLAAPLYRTLPDSQMIYTSLTEAFFTYLTLSCYVAMLFTVPFVLLQVYLFASPALLKREKRLVTPYIIATPIFFVIGALFAYFVVFPIAWKFFASFEMPQKILLQARVAEYLTLVMSLLNGFGIAFELPVLLTFLMQTNILSHSFVKSKRRYIIVIVFIISAILTPPDVLSQIIMAVPLLFLFETSLLIVSILNRKKSKA